MYPNVLVPNREGKNEDSYGGFVCLGIRNCKLCAKSGSFKMDVPKSFGIGRLCLSRGNDLWFSSMSPDPTDGAEPVKTGRRNAHCCARSRDFCRGSRTGAPSCAESFKRLRARGWNTGTFSAFRKHFIG